MRWRYKHDAEHARDLAAWRAQLPREQKRQVGPQPVLRAYTKAARKAFWTVALLVPEAERTTRPVCGVWTLKDLLGHITDWEKVGLIGLRQLADGHTPEFDTTIEDFDQWNSEQAAARQAQPWDEVMSDFHETREEFMDLFDTLPEERLARPVATPWGPTLTAYQFLSVWPGHEQEHAHDIQWALQLSWPEHLSS